MNILFLDMDGVVNRGRDNAKPDRYPYDDEWSHPGSKFDLFYVSPDLAERVTQLCNDYDLHIVASSSWRKFITTVEEYKVMLTNRFLPGDRLVGFTPNFGTPRKDEIKYFINNCEFPIHRYVILDDDSDARYNTKQGQFFQTSFNHGYTEAVDRKVREYLDKHSS